MSRRRFTEERRQATGPDVKGRLPNFLVVGAAKAGTSALASYLSRHPQVFIPPGKEMHFFNARFTIAGVDNYARGLEWYRECFAEAGDVPAVGEATPYYMFDESAPARMAMAMPDAKLIAILRNPIDRAYSHFCYWHSMFPAAASFAEVVQAEMRGDRSPYAVHRFPYLAAGRYLSQLERVCRHYPRASLYVLTFEELTTAPEQAFASVCRFLDIDDGVVPSNLGQVMNPTRPVRSERLRRAMLRWHAWKRLPPRLATAIDRLNRLKGSYPPMEPELRRELSAWFAADNEALETWLGRDLSGWNV